MKYLIHYDETTGKRKDIQSCEKEGMQNVWQKRGLKTVNTNNILDELLIFTGVFVGDKLVLSKADSAPSETTTVPVLLQRRQFQMILAFEVAVNQSRGKNLTFWDLCGIAISFSY